MSTVPQVEQKVESWEELFEDEVKIMQMNTEGVRKQLGRMSILVPEGVTPLLTEARPNRLKLVQFPAMAILRAYKFFVLSYHWHQRASANQRPRYSVFI